MTPDEQLTAIRADGDAFWDAIERADLDAPVAACPEWNAADLAWHLSEVHWFWATVVEQPITAVDQLETLDRRERPAPGDLVSDGREQLDRLIRVLAAASPGDHVWTWAPQQEVAFIARHQVQETAVHRWDAQAVAGDPRPIDEVVAVDGIDEFLTYMRDPAAGPPGTVHLHCTDADGEWIVHADGRVERAHAKGDAAMRATASDLVLALYRRVPIDQLDVVGDRAVAEAFLATSSTE